MKNVYLIFFILLISAGVKAQNCYASFSWLQNGTTVSFYGSASPNITNVFWNFGDGNFDYTNNQSPNHTYAGAGTYNVCMHFSDSANSCIDSTCSLIVIDSCYGSLNYTQVGDTVHFTGFGNGATIHAQYVWSFGDSQFTSQQNPTHIYSYSGIYTVCFSYYDSTTSCSDSVCTQIDVGGSGCHASFNTLDTVGYIFFINTSSPGSSGIYHWNFGDGNTSTQYNPSNIYDSTGTYYVCLSAYDSLNNFCDFSCQYVTITNLVGMNENENAISELTLSPNPSNENAKLSFYLNQSAEATFTVFDISGRMISTLSSGYFSSGKQTIQINTHDFSSGVYFIKSIVNGQTTTTKMIVSHQ